MRQVYQNKSFVMLIMVGIVVSSALESQAAGFGSRLKSLSWFGGDSESSAGSSPTPTVSATPHSASPRVASRQSQPIFETKPLAPRPSVTMPAPTSPTGSLPPAPRNDEEGGFGSRIWSAVSSTREALTIKPRESSSPDPVRLNNRVEGAEVPVFISAARVYETQGRLREAGEYYNKALAKDPENLDAQVGLARLKHREGNLVAATELYQRALRAHPNNPVVLNDLGLCYARRDMYQQARQSIEKAVEQDPSSKLYRNNLSLVLVEMGREDEAFVHLSHVHGEAVAHYNLAFLLKEKGRHDEAAEHLQTALQLSPRMEPARAMLAQLNPAPATNNAAQNNAAPNQQMQSPYNTRLGQPLVQQQPAVSPYGAQGVPNQGVANQGSPNQAAPVVQRSPYGSQPQYQPQQSLPVSHRQSGAAPPTNQNGWQQQPGTIYGSPNVNTQNGNTRNGPANVGSVNVRFDNGEPSDYRRGPTGTSASQASPAYGANYSREYQQPSGSTSSGQSYDTNYQNAPMPDAAPDYLRGGNSSQNSSGAGAAGTYPSQPPSYQPQQPAGGSRWTTQ